MTTHEPTILDNPNAGPLDVDFEIAKNGGADPAFRRQAVLVALGRRTIAPPDLSTLVQDAAALAAQAIDADRFGVAELQRDGASLALHFGATPQEGLSQQVDEHRIDSEDTRSASVHALSVAQPISIADLGDDTRVNDAVLRRLGVASALVCPLINVDRPFGTLGVYSTTPREFTREDALFVESIAHMMTTTIARHQAERALADHDRFSSAVLTTIEAPVLILEPDGRVAQMNRAFEECTGFSIEDVKGRHVWSAFLLPEEVGAVRAAFDRLRCGESPVQFDSRVLTKQGQRRQIAWSYTALRDDDGMIESLIGTGIDITELCETAERAERAENEADEAKRSLSLLQKSISEREGLVDLDDIVGPERRTRIRRPYTYIQYIAPMQKHTLPNRKEFAAVNCHDISARGFSYWGSEPPEYNEIVVAFGTLPTVFYLVAKIIHTTAEECDGQQMYRIGCRYTGRAAY